MLFKSIFHESRHDVAVENTKTETIKIGLYIDTPYLDYYLNFKSDVKIPARKFICAF